jgi:hypothetical protein
MEKNTPPHQLTRHGDSAETRSPVARLLTIGSIAAFMLGFVAIPVTGVFALIYGLDRQFERTEICGSDGCRWKQTFPASTHTDLVHALSLGGLTIALFALAVLLGLVQMRLRRLPLGGLLPGILLVAAVMVGAAVVLSLLPAARPWGVLLGAGSVVTLGVAWVQVMQLLNRARRAER